MVKECAHVTYIGGLIFEEVAGHLARDFIMTAACSSNSKRHLTSSLSITVTVAPQGRVDGAQPRASKHELDWPWGRCLSPETRAGARDPTVQAPWGLPGQLVCWSAGWLLNCKLAQLRDVDEGSPWTGVRVPSPTAPSAPGPGGPLLWSGVWLFASSQCVLLPDQRAVTRGPGEKSQASSVEWAAV